MICTFHKQSFLFFFFEFHVHTLDDPLYWPDLQGKGEADGQTEETPCQPECRVTKDSHRTNEQALYVQHCKIRAIKIRFRIPDNNRRLPKLVKCYRTEAKLNYEKKSKSNSEGEKIRMMQRMSQNAESEKFSN